MQSHLAAVLGSVVLTAGTLLGAPADSAQASAYPVTPFEPIEVGNTWMTDTITWFNRSVAVKGPQKSVRSAGSVSSVRLVARPGTTAASSFRPMSPAEPRSCASASMTAISRTCSAALTGGSDPSDRPEA